jgi:hypothetical protein
MAIAFGAVNGFSLCIVLASPFFRCPERMPYRQVLQQQAERN